MHKLPQIIQGGMGIAVSSSSLAKAVSRRGELGVVSGTAIDSVLIRRLQDGDIEGELRRAMASFPDQNFVLEVTNRYFRDGGKAHDESYLEAAKLSLNPSEFDSKLIVLANFVEVWLAKEDHQGLIGVNLLEKIQLATLPAIYGSLLAGVDYVLMGAGIPSEIPRALRELSRHQKSELKVDVDGATHEYKSRFDPQIVFGANEITISKPKFLAIISSHALSAYLNRDEVTRPDGFVVEGPTAGGHNAPPRGSTPVGPDGQSQFSEKDMADISKVASTGLPFWLAGSYSTPEKLQQAKQLGATGIQVGTIFALASESGLTTQLRAELLEKLALDELVVKTDPKASSTGFPFKLVELESTLSNPINYEKRIRVCDLGYLRTPFERDGKRIGYRCPGEPENTFVFKNGKAEDAKNIKCLCNGLMADIGLAQIRPGGYTELPMITLGSDLTGSKALLDLYPQGWNADQVLDYLLKV
jgi:NAD(P)H-dependent flavin oxidoreductase YrpB (nitropropane dioxygenase family)